MIMAENDIYDNKLRYERFVNNLNRLVEKPKNNLKRKYYCKNKENLEYYNKLIRYFKVNDLSYIRRLSLLNRMKFLTHYIECDLKDVNGIDREEIIIKCRETYSFSNLKRVEADIKQIGKILFEEEDIPKFFKVFKIKTDISRQKIRKDKLTYEEFERIMKFFSNDVIMQSYLSIAMETLVRPQEQCFITISGCEFYENHAILTVAEHGKEGIKRLLCIDSFPYLLKMYKNHRDSKNPNSFLFLNKYNNQLTPYSINKKLKLACKKLKINKPVTCYSLKRFGVTFRRLNGDDDVTIQRIAGWRSTKQLRTYDLSNQDDIFKRELAKRGLIQDDKLKDAPKTKPCPYCCELVGFAEDICPKCNHVLNKDLINERIKKDEELNHFIEGIGELKDSNPDVFEVIRDIGKEKGVI